jgi:hypothetical protein
MLYKKNDLKGYEALGKLDSRSKPGGVIFPI